MTIVVVILLIQGLLVKGFPAGQYESTDGELVADGKGLGESIPARAILENNGTVSPSEPVTLPESYEKSQEDILQLSAASSGNNAPENNDLIETAAFIEPILDQTIPAIERVVVNQTLAIVDELIESPLEKEDDKIKQPSLKNYNSTDVMNTAIYDLMELQTKLASELLNIKDTIESKMSVIRQKIKTAISENKMKAEAELKPQKLSNDSLINQPEINVAPKLAKTNPSVTSGSMKNDNCNSTPFKFEYDETLLVKGEEIEENLVKINDFIEFELAKIDSFVESELAATEALIKSEVDKINLIVESKILVTELEELEMNDTETNEDTEPASEIPVEGVAEFSGVVPATGRALIVGSTGYSPLLPVLVENPEETVTAEEKQSAIVPVVDRVPFSRIVPVSGRTFIFGNTGFLHPNLTPLQNSKKTIEQPNIINIIPISVETGPLTLESTEYNSVLDAIEPIPDTEVMFSETKVMPAELKVMLSETKAMLPDTKAMLPESKVMLPETKMKIGEGTAMGPIILNEDTSETIPVAGNAIFQGVTPAEGSVKITGSFGSPAPVSRISDVAKEDFPRNFPMVSKYTPEFPETVIMDSTKNYERLIEEYEVLDQEIDHDDVIVAGEVFFMGKTPATGSVKITGHSFC